MSRTLFCLTCAAAFAAHTNAAEDASSSPAWSLTNVTPVTTLCGLHATADEEVFAAVSDNAQGPGVEHTVDYGETDEFILTNGDIINMDIAFTDSKIDGTMFGMGSFLVTHDGKTFDRYSEDLRGVSQGAASFGDSLIGAAGSFYDKSTRPEAVNGVAVSQDKGQSWELFDLGLNSTDYYARYVAFPSADTWYVTSGKWPSDGVEDQETRVGELMKLDNNMRTGEDVEVALSQRLTRHVSSDGKHSLEYKQPPLESGPGAKAGLPIDPSSWYWGAVSKTSDGGATWEKVFDLHGLSYFNGIHCADTEHCMAVSENSEQAFVYSTTDGGKSWTQVMTTEPMVSLVGCYMLSTTEAWVSGGMPVKGVLTGYFYHTLDGGATWELKTLANAYSMKIVFSKEGNVGYSTAMSRAASTVAVYK